MWLLMATEKQQPTLRNLGWWQRLGTWGPDQRPEAYWADHRWQVAHQWHRKHSLGQQLFFSGHSKTFSMKEAVHRAAFQYKLHVSSQTGNSSKTSPLRSIYCSRMEANLVLEISVTAIKVLHFCGPPFFMFKTQMAEVHLPSKFCVSRTLWTLNFRIVYNIPLYSSLIGINKPKVKF